MWDVLGTARANANHAATRLVLVVGAANDPAVSAANELAPVDPMVSVGFGDDYCIHDRHSGVSHLPHRWPFTLATV